MPVRKKRTKKELKPPTDLELCVPKFFGQRGIQDIVCSEVVSVDWDEFSRTMALHLTDETLHYVSVRESVYIRFHQAIGFPTFKDAEEHFRVEAIIDSAPEKDYDNAFEAERARIANLYKK